MEKEGNQVFIKPGNRIKNTRASQIFSGFKNVCFYMK